MQACRKDTMIVDLKDGCCRTCGCTLRVIDADDATLTVSCIECSDTYEVCPCGRRAKTASSAAAPGVRRVAAGRTRGLRG
jgi:hypothetical protein